MGKKVSYVALCALAVATLLPAQSVHAQASTSWMDVQLCKSKHIQKREYNLVDSCYKQAGKYEKRWRALDHNAEGGIDPLDGREYQYSAQPLRDGFEGVDRRSMLKGIPQRSELIR